MNEFGEHRPTQDPALGDAAPEGEGGSERETVADKPRTGEPGTPTPSSGRDDEHAGTDPARGALSEHE